MLENYDRFNPYNGNLSIHLLYVNDQVYIILIGDPNCIVWYLITFIQNNEQEFCHGSISEILYQYLCWYAIMWIRDFLHQSNHIHLQFGDIFSA